MTRFLWWIVSVPVGIVLVALAVANRRSVTIAFDPFSPEAPVYSLSMPLFALIFGALILGVFIGGASVWLSQSRHRKSERRWREEADRLRIERDRIEAAERTARRGALPALNAPSNGKRAA